MRPICPASASPTWRHVAPASVDLYTPSPAETLPRIHAEPMPTYTTFGSDGATATAPTEALPSVSPARTCGSLAVDGSGGAPSPIGRAAGSGLSSRTLSGTLRQVRPPSVVFQTPPPVVPM